MIEQERKNAIVEAAKDALKTPYAVETKQNYSAAVLTKEGNIYPGISYFSDTYSLTIHGEQAALSHAASHGEGDILAIAIASNEDKKEGEFTNPCHMCKQVLYESSKRSNLPMLVILTNKNGETKEIDLSEMMPYPWPQ